MPKKPWRTVKIFGPTGRFTREQLREAIRAVREERERAASAAEPCGTELADAQVQVEEKANSTR